MTFYKNRLLQCITIFLALLNAPLLVGRETGARGVGLKVPSKEAMEVIEHDWERVIKVKPNKVALERIRQYRVRDNLPHVELVATTPAEEMISVKGKDYQLFRDVVLSDPIVLPKSVDNSQLPSFPPIGDQKQLGSCVGWGTTYYQATHEYGLLNGINNKSSYAYIFSPKWTYNNLNDGQDGGLSMFETYQLLTQNGLVSIANFPYDSDFRAWDLNTTDWINAPKYRFKEAKLVSGIGGDSQDLQVIKQLLANGHVLTMGTYVNSWVVDQVKQDPSTPSVHAGELGCIYMSGRSGGHCMTIVGYDDNIWFDINKNGQADPGEKGAFLIANSWGKDWGNNGFVWVSYDAFRSRSGVDGGPNSNRVPLASALNNQVVTAVPLAPNYTPKMIAEFSLTQNLRNQITVSVGVSDQNSSTPTRTFSSYALAQQGGSYKFDGKAPTSVQTASFAIDLTDIMSQMSGDSYRFYLIVNDFNTGNPTTIQSFKVTDIAKGKSAVCSQLPQTCDNKTVKPYVDFSYSDQIPVEPPKVAITSPSRNSKLKDRFWFTANATDARGIDRVEFYLDSRLQSIDSTPPYQIYVNTKTYGKGSHKLTAVVYNKSGLSSRDSIDVIFR